MDSNFLKEIEPLNISENDEFMKKYIDIPKSVIKNILYDKIDRDIDINVIINNYLKSFVVDKGKVDTFLLFRDEIVNDTINPEDTELIRKVFKNINICSIEGKLKHQPSYYVLEYLNIVKTGADLLDIDIEVDNNREYLSKIEVSRLTELCRDIDRLIPVSNCIPYIPKVIKSFIIKNIDTIDVYKEGDINMYTGLPSDKVSAFDFNDLDYNTIMDNNGYSYYNLLDTYIKGGYKSAILRDISALTKVLNKEVILRLNGAKDEKSINRVIEKSFMLNLNSNVSLPTFEMENSPVPLQEIKVFINEVFQEIKPSNIDFTLILHDIKIKSYSLNRTYMVGVVNDMYKNYHDPDKEELLNNIINLKMLKSWLSLFGPIIPDKYINLVNKSISDEDILLRSRLKLIPKMTDVQLDNRKRMSKAAYMQYLKTGETVHLSNVDFNYVPASLLTEDSPAYKAKGHWCKEYIIRDYNLDSHEDIIDVDLTVADLLQIAERYEPSLYDDLPAALVEEVESVVRVVSKEVVNLLKEDTRFKIKYEVY